MEKDNILTDRVSQDYSISETSYITGVVEITEYLFIELIDLLKTEDKSVTQLGKKEAGCILKKKNHR